jgi:hypothetical protein
MTAPAVRVFLGVLRSLCASCREACSKTTVFSETLRDDVSKCEGMLNYVSECRL